MRTMPQNISANGIDAEPKVLLPSIPRAEWFAKLAEIAGRPLTKPEVARAEKMGDHNWTLQVVASELFGEHVADAFFASRD